MPEIIWNWGDDVVVAAHSLVSAGAASADRGCLGPAGFWWKPSFSFCTVGVATQTLCHTLFSLSVCLPDGPWPSQPYLHLLAGPASHHRGRLLAGNTQLQSLCSRILHRGCVFFVHFLPFGLAETTAHKTSDIGHQSCTDSWHFLCDASRAKRRVIGGLRFFLFIPTTWVKVVIHHNIWDDKNSFYLFIRNFKHWRTL